MQADRRHSKKEAARRHLREKRAQQRRFFLVVGVLAVTVIATAATSYASRAEAVPDTPVVEQGASTTTLDPAATLVSATYEAELKASGSGSTLGSAPAVLTIQYDAVAQSVSYKLDITSPLANPCVAAISQGTPGHSGGTVFTIFPGPAVSGNFSGILSQGAITTADLVGPLKGRRLTDLVLLIKAGGAYVSVGTVSHPIDALRGQIK